MPADEDYAIRPRVSGELRRSSRTARRARRRDAVLASASEAAATFNSASDIENGYASAVEPAAETHAGVRSALDGDDPCGELGAIDDHNDIIAVTEHDYTEPPPADVPDQDRANRRPTRAAPTTRRRRPEEECYGRSRCGVREDSATSRTYERDGSLTKNRVYVFYLGKRGPFTVKVPLANFDPLEIDRRVQELRSHLVNLPK